MVDDGDSPVGAITVELKSEGIAYTMVWTTPAVPSPLTRFGAGSAEQTALESCGIRMAFRRSTPTPGPIPRWASIAPTRAVTPASSTDVRSNSHSLQESFGFVAKPRTGFTRYVDVFVPGSTDKATPIRMTAADAQYEAQ
ncbi:hypothetical protein [Streptomyces sp. NPDC101165]|uniref:hypothetical protein n=1 Tax=Streptomyces sp. NPDC101165 TaxID=3366119 RepID=UPI00380705C1